MFRDNAGSCPNVSILERGPVGTSLLVTAAPAVPICALSAGLAQLGSGTSTQSTTSIPSVPAPWHPLLQHELGDLHGVKSGSF
jgi:hypothetical protein